MTSSMGIFILFLTVVAYAVPVALIVLTVIWARKVTSLLTEIRDSLNKP